ncbi:MAG: FprA family A-type flavoprotein [Dehalococcoidia bacterium]|nr:MAG: FprA family A-type flavoprotein [Dehalococcoidia bacterium]
MSQAIIIYDTRSGNTEKMAKAIEEGMQEAGVKVLSKRTVNAKADDLTNVDAVVLGAPTYHHDLIQSMKTFLFQMEKADLKGKIGAAFGSYGWSGESVQMMTDTMKHIFGMSVIEPGLKILRRPDESGLKQCQEFGREIAEKIEHGKK